MRDPEAMLCRDEALGRFSETALPDAIRFSIRPKTMSGPKFTVSMIPGQTRAAAQVCSCGVNTENMRLQMNALAIVLISSSVRACDRS